MADYEENLKLLQQERLKFLRLSLSDGFKNEPNNSKESWMNHLKQLEDSLSVRLKAIRAFIKDAAQQIEQSEEEDATFQR
jgi:hypothetical protein